MHRMNRHWLLAAHPEDLIKDSDFRLTEAPVRELRDEAVLVRNRYL